MSGAKVWGNEKEEKLFQLQREIYTTTIFHSSTLTMSTTFDVLRYSALGAGLFYGAYHRYSLELSFALEIMVRCVARLLFALEINAGF